MRLIDADKFEVVAFQGKSEDFSDGVMWLLEQIDEAPTVFDMNNVVTQLEDLKAKSVLAGELQDVYQQAIDSAIEVIVNSCKIKKK